MTRETISNWTMKAVILALFLGLIFLVARIGLCVSGNPILAPIDAAKIADGSVTDAEFQYINTLSSNAQDQITARQFISLSATPGSDHTASGPQTDDINAGEAITVMDCVYLHSDGEWHQADADAVATGEGMLAISLEAKTNGQAMNVALPGTFVRDDSWTWTVGGEIYLSCTAGSITQTAPSGTDDVVRVIGYATHADRLFFDPDKTIIVHD